ncbi:MAG: TonB-dependent receptor plug domain-containing protein [Sulfurimonas sp.]
MNFFLLLITLFFTSLLVTADDNIDSMLQNLRKKSELHNKTKEENAGFVTIYSREDLDRMQAYTLKDILKSIPFMTYQEGLVGTPTIANVGSALNYMPNTRLYIDNHEVSSTYFGSAFYIYGDMKLGFVDHIEVYQGGNGLDFGIESSLRTIRVYTKTPHRENNTQAKILADNRGSLSEHIYSGQEIDDVEYGVYVSGNQNNREDFNNNGSNLSKDAKKTHVLMTLKTKGFNLLTSRYDSLQDGFAGYGANSAPKGTNEINKYHQFLYASYDIVDNLTAYASIDDSMSSMNFYEPNGYNRGLSSSLDVKWKENIYKGGIKGSKIVASNYFKYGFEYAEKTLKPEQSEYENLNTLNVKGPTCINLNSIYVEDSFKITEASTLTGTTKLDHFSDNYNNEAKIEPVFRVGYTYDFYEDYKAKISYNHTYISPSLFYTTTYSGKTQVNPEILPSRYNGLTTEFAKKSNNTQVKVGAIYFELENGIYFNSISKQYDNINTKTKLTNLYLEFKYSFDLFNSLDFNVYRGVNSENLQYSSDRGATVRLLNTYNKFNFFNEITYRSDYTSVENIKIDAGFDYSLGASYKVNKKLSFDIKGENIFNKASQTPILGVGSVSSIDRTFIFGMEYLF